MAAKYPAWSPYNFTMNNPIGLVDPNGDSSHVAQLHALFPVEWGKTKSDLELIGGLKIDVSPSGMARATIDENAENYSAKGREAILEMFGGNDLIVIGGTLEGGSNAGGSEITLDINQINEFIKTATGVDNKTLGFGMSLLHEYGHTVKGGSLKDVNSDGSNGLNVKRMNEIRSEISSVTGTNWGERFYHSHKSWNFSEYVIPFSKQGRRDLVDYQIATPPFILSTKKPN